MSFARNGLASALMGAAVVGIRALLPGVGLLVTGAGGLALGAAIDIIAVLALGSEELRELPGLLLNKRAASHRMPMLSLTHVAQ